MKINSYKGIARGITLDVATRISNSVTAHEPSDVYRYLYWCGFNRDEAFRRSTTRIGTAGVPGLGISGSDRKTLRSPLVPTGPVRRSSWTPRGMAQPNQVAGTSFPSSDTGKEATRMKAPMKELHGVENGAHFLQKLEFAVVGDLL